MARRVKFKVGDLFLVPLNEEWKGVGRILKINESTVFIELYYMYPIRALEEFNFDEVIKHEPIVMSWMYYDTIRNGEWEIFDNKPVTNDYEMPYFWYHDAGDRKYYIEKGSQDSFRTVGERIEIPREDISKYNSSGIGDGIYEKKLFIKRLKEAGLYVTEE